jgi:hypothetical protein
VWTGLDDCDDQDPLTFPGAAEQESATACTTDADDDGWGGADVVPEATPGTDCDDLDPTRAPGIAEVWYDDVDEHCDGGDDWDADGDGVHPAPLGDDCDDLHADAHPGGVEVYGDGVDQDCDGLDPCPLGLDPACARPSCADLLAEGAIADGVYWIAPAGREPFQAICDQTRDGGGWTLAAVISKDGRVSWTSLSMNWTTGDGVFGDVTTPSRDLRSPAFRSVPVHDLLFVHAPSLTWAAYADVGDGTVDLGTLSSRTAATCYASRPGFPMTAGDLTAGGGGTYWLCSTDLFLGPRDQAGSAGACTSATAGNALGPAWSVSANTSASFCPMYNPGQHAGLGPVQTDVTVESDSLGWGRAKGYNVGGALSDGTQHMSVYVR